MRSKPVRYLKMLFFGIAILSTVDFWSRNGMDAAARFQYHNLDETGFLRSLADCLLILSLTLLAIKEFANKVDRYYKTAVIIYTFLILPDIIVWLWMAEYSGLYYYITLIHTLPLLLILRNYFAAASVKDWGVLGSVVFCVYLLFNAAFLNVPYQDAPYEIIEKTIMYQKAANLILFSAVVFVLIALNRFVEEKMT